VHSCALINRLDEAHARKVVKQLIAAPALVLRSPDSSHRESTERDDKSESRSRDFFVRSQLPSRETRRVEIVAAI
jgi:hypothetical protein